MRDNEVIYNWQYSAILIGFTLGTAMIYSFSMLYASRGALIFEISGVITDIIFLIIPICIIFFILLEKNKKCRGLKL